MLYPQTFIDDLRRQADIVRVIQDYVSLKKKGANWMACCPFHKEKTPSFSVSPAKEIFYCFGCHKGGSVFNFVMEIEGVAFPEAIRIVAEKAGVPLPKLVDDSRYEARRHEADEVIQLNTWALEWWQQQLESAGSEARMAREYISRREITDETQKIFRLGYAPDSWDALSLHLRQKGATQTQIENSGLVVKKDEGGSYDRFRGRLIFPVFDVQGRPIAFGGRTLKANEPAKYINSPETSVYVKGRNLFGLNLNRGEIRRQGFAILVEGFFDLIVPYQAGVRNTVASLGTALTPEQVRLLGRFARKVVVNYDGDHAGVKAAMRAIEVLLREDFEVKVLTLRDDADPDEFIREHGVGEYEQIQTVSSLNEFIRKYGANKFQERRGQAQPHIEFVINQAIQNRDLRRPAEKAIAVEEVLPYVRAVRNGMQKREYFDMAMEALRVSDLTLRRELWQTVKIGAKEGEVREKMLRRTAVKPTVAEQRLLELLVSTAEIRQTILPQLEPEDYGDLPTAPLFAALLEFQTQGMLDLSALRQKLQDDSVTTQLLHHLLMDESANLLEEGDATPRAALAEKCLNALRLMRVDRRISELSAEIAAAERESNSERLGTLSVEQIELTRRRSALLPQADSAAID
jgi:DNA primase